MRRCSAGAGSRGGRTLAPDAEALARTAAGDASAFHTVVRLHEARVRGFLRRVARDGDVDDLAQQAFVTAWRRAGQYRGQGSVGAWLLGIAWSAFLMERRGSARERRRREAFGAVAETQTTSAPEAGLDAERVLARLDPRERAALVLTLGMGHSQAEAAAILAIPLGTLKTVQARARTKAAAALEGGRP